MRRAGALSALTLLGTETAIVFGTSALDRLDQAVLIRGTGLVFGDQGLREAVVQITRIGDPSTFVVIGLVVVGGAWCARGPSAAGRCCAVVVGANLTTQLLQPLFEGAREVSLASHLAFVYPSGHATAIASVGACLPLLFAGRTRVLAAAVAAGLIVTMSSALVLGGTHLFSDVVAALLIVIGWTFAVGPEPARVPEPRMRLVAGAIAALASAVLLGSGGLGGVRAVSALWSRLRLRSQRTGRSRLSRGRVPRRRRPWVVRSSAGPRTRD